LEDIMSEQRLVDVTGRLRSPAATPGHWLDTRRRTRGSATRPTRPRSSQIILVMRYARPGRYANRTVH
jgi:hypothetical protein